MTLLSRVAAQEIGIELALPTAPEIVLNTTHSLVIIDQQAHRLSLRNLTDYFKNKKKQATFMPNLGLKLPPCLP